MGYSLVQVAVEYDPSEAGGWDEALSLLGAVSVGLILYGFYFVLLVRYRTL